MKSGIPFILRLVRLSFQQQLTYRTAILSGMATNLFFAILRAALLIALYGGSDTVNGLSLRGAITYVAISQGLMTFLLVFGSYDLMNTISTGSIGSDLLKPVHLYTLWLGRDLGRSLVNLVGRGLFLVVLFALFYPVQFPGSAGQWAGFLAALVLSWLVSFSWRFLVNLSAFWTIDGRGVGRIAFTVSQLLAGFLVPLRLYPDWFARLCHLTPFPALFNTTVEAYLGLLTGTDLVWALANQAAWFLGLAVLSHLFFLAGVRRLVVQGG